MADVHRWIQTHIRYRLDPDGTDTFLSAEATLAQREGDCADQVILEVGMLRAIGIPAWPAYVDYGRGLEHVIVAAHPNDGEAIPLDPIDYTRGVGQWPRGDVYEVKGSPEQPEVSMIGVGSHMSTRGAYAMRGSGYHERFGPTSLGFNRAGADLESITGGSGVYGWSLGHVANCVDVAAPIAGLPISGLPISRGMGGISLGSVPQFSVIGIGGMPLGITASSATCEYVGGAYRRPGESDEAFSYRANLCAGFEGDPEWYESLLQQVAVGTVMTLAQREGIMMPRTPPPPPAPPMPVEKKAAIGVGVVAAIAAAAYFWTTRKKGK